MLYRSKGGAPHFTYLKKPAKAAMCVSHSDKIINSGYYKRLIRGWPWGYVITYLSMAHGRRFIEGMEVLCKLPL